MSVLVYETPLKLEKFAFSATFTSMRARSNDETGVLRVCRCVGVGGFVAVNFGVCIEIEQMCTSKRPTIY